MIESTAPPSAPARRWLTAVALATVFVAVLAARGFTTIEGTRARIVTSSQEAERGRLVFTTAEHPEVNTLAAPFALIARVELPASVAGSVDILIDGNPACKTAVAAGAKLRIDCVVESWDATRPTHQVAVIGPERGFTVNYLELAVHHGASSGFNRLFFLPRGAARFERPGAVWLGGLWLALVAAGAFLRRPRLPRWLAIGHAAIAAVIAVALVVIVIAPWVSRYQVIVSAGTMLRWALLLFLPQLVDAALRGWRHAAAQQWLVLSVRCALVGLVVFLFFGLLTRLLVRDFYHGNYSGVVHVAEPAFNGNPLVSARDDVRASLLLQPSGYDAQFMYFGAFDPLMRQLRDDPHAYRGVMDAPPYRFGRIGYIWLIRLASLGQWPRFPAAMVWLVLTALTATAVALALIASRAGASPAWGLLVLLVPGFWQSVVTALPEPIAAAFIAWGYLSLSGRRWITAGVLFAAALLVRETGVILIGALLLDVALTGEWRRAFIVGVIAAVPVTLWRLYMGWTLFPDWGWQGFMFNPHDLGVPMHGFVDLWATVRRGEYEPGLRTAAIVFPLLLTGAFVTAVAIARRRVSGLTLAAVFYGLIAISLNYEAIWVHIGNGQRGTFEVFLLLALSSITIVRVSRAMRVGVMVFWASSLWYVFYGSFDAGLIRTALMSGW